MQAAVKWEKGLDFQATTNSGITLGIGSGGEESRPGPMELVLVSLVGCTAMDVISILEKKRQNVTGFEVTAEAERADDYPKVYTRVTVHYRVTGRDIDPRAVERAIELSETKYCPVHAMLSKSVEIELTYEIVEA